jgi:hypothetical protein
MPAKYKTILYYVQNYPGESMSTPNCLKLLSDTSVKFGDVLDAFPNQSLPGPTHWRFKVTMPKETTFVWKDCTSRDEIVPESEDGTIFAKVLVLDENTHQSFRSRLRYKKSELDARSMPSLGKEEIFDAGGSDSVRSSVRERDNGGGVTNIFDNNNFSQSKGSSSGSGGTDLGAGAVQSKPEAPEAPEAPAAPVYVEKKLDRHELAQARQDKVAERIQEAKEFKNELDEQARRDMAEVEQAKATHDARLTAWAFKGKERNNVRSLLSTMHTVLWEGNRWKECGLGDVIEPKKVKLQYRKAMLVVHPDRCSNLSVEVRFIAKRIFEAINEAYNDFLTKEDV